MKRFLSLIMAFTLVMSIGFTAFAADKSQTTVATEDWGNGLTAVITTTVTDDDAATRATYSRKANRTWTIYKGSTSIGSATLYVTFMYNGTSAWVHAFNTSHTTASGWSYGDETVTVSGGKCTLSAKFTGSANVSFSKSLSCSPTGVIS